MRKTGHIWDVCEPCNNGWMSRLNTAVDAPIDRLCAGDWALGPEERRIVAAWLTMLTMSYEHHDKDTMATQFDERSRLREEIAPPPNWFVLAAPHDAPNWQDRLNHTGAASADWIEGEDAPKPEIAEGAPPCDLQLTVSTFNTIAFMTVSAHGDPEACETHGQLADFAERRGFQLIWPIEADLVQPQAAVDDRLMDEVANQFFREMGMASAGPKAG